MSSKLGAEIQTPVLISFSSSCYYMVFASKGLLPVNYSLFGVNTPCIFQKKLVVLCGNDTNVSKMSIFRGVFCKTFDMIS